MATTENVFNWLEEQGFRPKYDDDQDIVFKYQMLTFIYFNNDEDEPFVRLALPGIYDVTDDNRMAVLEAANEISKNIKVVKAFVPIDDVWLSTEILMDSTPIIDDVFPRLLNILMKARREFYEQMED